MIYDILKIWRKRLTYSLTELMNDEAVYRTAPATPGLLITEILSDRGDCRTAPATPGLLNISIGNMTSIQT